jgi:hypothetical protein
MGLDLFNEHAAENIAPGVVDGAVHPGLVREHREAPVIAPPRQRRQQVDAGVVFECFRDRETLGLGKGSAVRSR